MARTGQDQVVVITGTALEFARRKATVVATARGGRRALEETEGRVAVRA